MLPLVQAALSPQGSWGKDRIEEGRRHCDRLRDLAALAEKLGCSPTQLSIAWSLKHEPVQCLLLGATSAEQLHQSLQSLQVSRHSARSNERMHINGAFDGGIQYSCCRVSRRAWCWNWSGYWRISRCDRQWYRHWRFGDNQPARRVRSAWAAAGPAAPIRPSTRRRRSLRRQMPRRLPSRVSVLFSDERSP